MRKLLISIAAVAAALLAARPAAGATVGAVAQIKGIREHQVFGVGLVIGLNGTGDKARETRKRIAMLLKRLKFNVDPTDLASKNIAMVFVTAKIKSDTAKGTTIDVSVASMGDATSLDKGILLATPLHTNETEVVYARAQGTIAIGSGAHLTAATMTNAATLEKEIPSKALDKQRINEKGEKIYYFDLVLNTDKASFRRASEIADNINTSLRRTEANPAARVMSSSQVRVEIPKKYENRRAAFVSNEIMNVPVMIDPSAKVVIIERKGLVVVTGNVRISPADITVGARRILISKEGPLADLKEAMGRLDTLDNGYMGSGAEMIDILKALDKADALQAKLVIK